MNINWQKAVPSINSNFISLISHTHTLCLKLERSIHFSLLSHKQWISPPYPHPEKIPFSHFSLGLHITQYLAYNFLEDKSSRSYQGRIDTLLGGPWMFENLELLIPEKRWLSGEVNVYPCLCIPWFPSIGSNLPIFLGKTILPSLWI